MSIADLAFYAFALVTVGAGFLVVVSRNPVHSVLWLILSFFSAAARAKRTPRSGQTRSRSEAPSSHPSSRRPQPQASIGHPPCQLTPSFRPWAMTRETSRAQSRRR
mgnify:CR=1 FL=1